MHRGLSIRPAPLVAICVGLVSIALSKPAPAHTMNMFAYVESGAIRGEVFARGGSPIVGAKITAYGPGGETLAETKADDKGEFSLGATRRCDWRLVAVTDDGHQAEYTVPAEELPPDLPDGGSNPALPPKPPAHAPAASTASQTPEPVNHTPAAGEIEELSRQLSAIRRELNQFHEKLRWQDTIGGIGYILGLMGLVFYFLGVQKRDRDQTPPQSLSRPAMHHVATHSGPWLDRIDPRSRILAALAFSLLTAVTNRPLAVLAALAVAVACTAMSGLRPVTVLRRMTPVNVFMLLLIALMPLTSGGREIGRLGPLHYGEDGLRLALTIAVKGNAIVLMLVALLGSLDITTVGHAMNHLRVPDKLTHLLLFTVRYLDVLRREYGRLNAAMRLRGFQPGANMHTYRTYGHLFGMLLVRSLDRSERVVAAMKCRGFHGHFYLLIHFHYSPLDVPFALATVVVLAGLAWLEWL